MIFAVSKEIGRIHNFRMKVSHLHLSINPYKLNTVVHNSMPHIVRSTFKMHVTFCNVTSTSFATLIAASLSTAKMIEPSGIKPILDTMPRGKLISLPVAAAAAYSVSHDESPEIQKLRFNSSRLMRDDTTTHKNTKSNHRIWKSPRST